MLPSSTLVREADGFILTQAGQEIAVASTKAFSTQIAALYWFAHRLAFEKNRSPFATSNGSRRSYWWLQKSLKIVLKIIDDEITQKHCSFLRTI